MRDALYKKCVFFWLLEACISYEFYPCINNHVCINISEYERLITLKIEMYSFLFYDH